MKAGKPQIALGTMQFLWTLSDEQSYRVLDAFFDAGGKYIDTADMYTNWVPGLHGGEAETIIGKWLKKRKNRNKIFLTTKVRAKMWQGKYGEGLSKRHIIKACEQSLKRLQTDHLDLYLSHWEDPTVPIEETLSAYQLLIKQGKIRSVGCSNYAKDALEESLRVGKKIGIQYQYVEAYYNLIDREGFETNILPLVKKYNLSVFPYSPLASGFLTGSYKKNKPLPQNVRAVFVKEKYTDRNFSILATIEKIAKKYNATVSQIALAWLLHKNFVTAPIIGVDSVEQLQENLPALQITLPAEDKEALDKVSNYLSTS